MSTKKRLSNDEIKDLIFSNIKKYEMDRKNTIYDIALKYLEECIKYKYTDNSFSLSEKELKVVGDRLGINELNSIKALKEIGEEIEYSKERVRQFEIKSLRKIRNRVNFCITALRIDELELPKNIKEHLFANNDLQSFYDYFKTSNNILDNVKDSALKYASNKVSFEQLNMAIENLGLSTNAYKELKYNGVNTVLEFVFLTDKEIRKRYPTLIYNELITVRDSILNDKSNELNGKSK